MNHRHFCALAALSMVAGAPLAVADIAQAQMPSMPSAGGMAGGMAGGATSGLGMPNVSSMGAGNATGVLSYCVKNNVLSGSDATSTLGALTGKPEVKSSDGFTAGSAGNIVSGDGSKVSLDSMPPSMKTKACGMVLKQAKSFM
jgi:Protein of unknown function (DUF2501)